MAQEELMWVKCDNCYAGLFEARESSALPALVFCDVECLGQYWLKTRFAKRGRVKEQNRP